MTTLTKEQVEVFKAMAQNGVRAYEPKYVIALCEAALRDIDMRPRPIGPEANGRAILCIYDTGECMAIRAEDNDFEFEPYKGPHGRGVSTPVAWIPLEVISALPTGGE